MNDFYAHTFRLSNFNEIDFFKLEDIFKSGYLLSRNQLRKLGDTSIATSECTSLYNGMDYISLCDLNMEHSNYSSYSMYTQKGLSLLFDYSINVIKPKIIDRPIFLIYPIDKVDLINNRYTDLSDEVQVKDQLSLEYLRGFSLSLSSFFSHHDQNYLLRYLRKLNRLIEKYNYDVSIYNLDNGEKIKKKT